MIGLLNNPAPLDLRMVVALEAINAKEANEDGELPKWVTWVTNRLNTELGWFKGKTESEQMVLDCVWVLFGFA